MSARLFGLKRKRPRYRRLRTEPLETRHLLTITVDTLTDEADGSIIDGAVSLRDAIALAPSGETIDFSAAGTHVVIDGGRKLW
jgi:hypothetical protein